MLKSLTLIGCNFWLDAQSHFPDWTATLVRLQRCTVLDEDQLDFLHALPPSVNALELDSEHSYTYGEGLDYVKSSTRARDIGRQLTSFSFVDEPWAPRRGPPYPVDRGGLDDFVANLDNVKHLTISPIAISDVAALARLSRLESLRLVIGGACTDAPTRRAEVVELFQRSTSLQHVEIGAGLANSWPTHSKQLLLAAAGHKIKLDWA